MSFLTSEINLYTSDLLYMKNIIKNVIVILDKSTKSQNLENEANIGRAQKYITTQIITRKNTFLQI